MEAAPSASVSNSKASRRANRLSKEGVQILRDYIAQHPNAGYPSLEVRRHLREQIRLLKGFEDYPLVNVNAWFQRNFHNASTSSPAMVVDTPQPAPSSSVSQQMELREWMKDRVNEKAQEKKSISYSQTPQYLSLTPSSIEHLRILAQAQPNPPAMVINTWAMLLGATEQDVTAWLHANLAAAAPPPPIFPLPSTPTFAQQDTSQQFASPAGTPVQHEPAGPAPLPKKSLIALGTSSPAVGAFNAGAKRKAEAAVPPLPVTHHPAAGIPPQIGQMHARTSVQSDILQAIAQISLNPPQSTETPKNAEEFKALFAPYEEKMKVLLQKLG